MGLIDSDTVKKLKEASLGFLKTNKWTFLLASELILALTVAIVVNIANTQENEAADKQSVIPVYVKQATLQPQTTSDDVSIFSFTAEVINVSSAAYETTPSIILARDYAFDNMDVWLYPSNISDEVIITDASVGFQIAYGNSDIKLGHIDSGDAQELYACKFMTTGDVLDGVGIDPVTGVASETKSYNKDMFAFRDIINLKIAVTGSPEEVHEKLEQMQCLLEIQVTDVNDSYNSYIVSSDRQRLADCMVS